MTEFIEIRGARENNLRDITLRIPKRQVTIFTGVSGSGKSSVVFDTIATEAQRQLYENFSLFVRSFLPKYPPPEAGTRFVPVKNSETTGVHTAPAPDRAGRQAPRKGTA